MVSSVKFSPDGNRIVIASSDCTGRVWDSESVNALGTQIGGGMLRAISGREITSNGQLHWLSGVEWIKAKNALRSELADTKLDKILR